MKGILKKMLINISLLVVVISVFLGAVSYYVSSGALISETEASLLSKANDNAKLLEERMAGKSKELETLAAQNDITGMNWQQQKPLLEKEAKRLDYLGIAIVDLQGQARYTDESTLDLSDRDYVQKSLKGQKAISDIIISRKT
ncbi:MAG: methyl-accepting chemotaxis protein, partial [Clostridia bacterium]